MTSFNSLTEERDIETNNQLNIDTIKFKFYSSFESLTGFHCNSLLILTKEIWDCPLNLISDSLGNQRLDFIVTAKVIKDLLLSNYYGSFAFLLFLVPYFDCI